MGKIYRSLSLYKKIIVWLFMISVIPILFIQITSYIISKKTLTSQSDELFSTNMHQTVISMENFFDNYNGIISDIYTDGECIQNIKYINSWDAKKYYKAKHELEAKFESICEINDALLGISIVDNHGEQIFFDTITMSGEESKVFYNDDNISDKLKKRCSYDRKTVYSETMQLKDAYGNDCNAFYMAHQLTDFNDSEKGIIGTLILCMKEEYLRNIIAGNEDTSGKMMMLLDRNGSIISMPATWYIGRNVLQYADSVDLTNASKEFFLKNNILNSNHIEVYREDILGGAFVLICIQNVDKSMGTINRVTSYIIVIGVVAALLCVFMGMGFAGDIEESVSKIISAMKKSKDSSEIHHINMEGNDEFAVIAQNYNEMMDRLKESEEKSREALLKKKDAELKSLEAQINPHFLYNTLDAINWVALDHDEMDISKMLVSLAAIMRYSIKNSNKIVTFADEVDYLKKYLYLQQERFEYSFEYSLQVEDQVLQCKTRKLILQPLIENAIIHGFPSGKDKDRLLIGIIKKNDDYIQVQISDNGKGMTREQVEYYNYYDYRKEEIKSRGIGVENVIARLWLYYGDNSSFHIFSNEEGTTISLLLPYIV